MQTRNACLSLPPASALGPSSLVLGLRGEEAVVERLISVLHEAAAQSKGSCMSCSVDSPAALLLALDAAAKLEEQESTLKALAQYLRDLALERGQYLQVSAMPVFLVLVGVERLAKAEETPESWAARVNTTTIERSYLFTSFLHHRIVQDRRLFGTLRLEPMAVSVGAAPSLTFAAHELLKRLNVAGSEHTTRQVRQGRRTAGFALLASVTLTLLISSSLLLGWSRLQRTAEEAVQATGRNEPDPVVQLIAQLQRLVRFEGYRSSQATQWVQWMQDAQQSMTKRAQFNPAPNTNLVHLDRLTDAVRSLSERVQFLGLVRVEKPDFPVLQPLTEKPPTLQQLRQTSIVLRNYLEQKSRFAHDAGWPEEIPLVVVEELRAAAGRAYDEWLEPVRRHLRQAAASSKLEGKAFWNVTIKEWLLKEALPHLEEWHAIARFLQLQAGKQPFDLFEELGAFLDQQEAQLDLGKVRLLLPTETLLHEGKKQELRPLELRLVWREGDNKLGTWRYRVERVTPLLGHALAIVEFARMEEAEEQVGPITFKIGQQLAATVEAADAQSERWLIAWNPAPVGSPWLGLYVLTEPPRIIPSQQTDARLGILLPQARWVYPAMDVWKLPDLLPRSLEPTP